MKKGDLVYIIAEDAVAIFLEKYGPFEGYPQEKIIFVEGEERLFFEHELEVISV